MQVEPGEWGNNSKRNHQTIIVREWAIKHLGSKKMEETTYPPLGVVHILTDNSEGGNGRCLLKFNDMLLKFNKNWVKDDQKRYVLHGQFSGKMGD